MSYDFRPIPGFEGRYEINFFGEVRSVSRLIAMGYEHRGTSHAGGIILKPRGTLSRRQNLTIWHVSLTEARRSARGFLVQAHAPIARLLWSAFRAPLDPGCIIRIIENNGEPSCLKADNLAMIDRRLNRLLNNCDETALRNARAELGAVVASQRGLWLQAPMEAAA